MLEFLYNNAVYLLYPAASLLLSLLLTAAAIRILPKLGLIDIPRGRHQHEKAVPRGGGIAIIVSFFAISYLLAGVLHWNGHEKADELLLFLRNFIIPSALITILGIIDDRFELRSITKLLVQIAAVLVLCYENCGITNLFSWQLPIIISIALTVVWYIVIINAFNLIDGADGVASGLAAIATIVLAVWSIFIDGYSMMTILLLIFCGSSLGFLYFNFAPAKIFMGDTGSMFIGLFMAYISTQYSAKAATLTALLVPVSVVGIPIFDLVLAVWRRLFRKYIKKDSNSGIMQGDHDHLHHRVLKETGRPIKTACIIYALALILSLLLMFCALLQSYFPTMIFISVLVIVSIIIRFSSIEIFDAMTYAYNGLNHSSRRKFTVLIHPFLDILTVTVSFLFCNYVYSKYFTPFNSKYFILSHILPVVFVLCISGVYRFYWYRSSIIQYYRLLRTLIIAGVSTYILNNLLALIPGQFLQNDYLWQYTLFYIAFFLLSAALIMGERFVLYYYVNFGYYKLFIRNQGHKSNLPGVLIYGGGLLCRIYISCIYSDFSRNGGNVRVQGIIDDDQALTGFNVYGFPVLGSLNDLENIYAKKPFNILVVTCRNISEEKRSLLQKFAAGHCIELKFFECKETDMLKKD